MPEAPGFEATEAAPAAAEAAMTEVATGEPANDDTTSHAAVDDSSVTPEAAPVVADEVLLASVDLARRALLDVTAPETVGSVVGHIAEGEHVLTLLFASDLSGYPGWRWSVTIARVEDGGPTVLETELMPGESALLAPDWIPWSERLADYRAAQDAAAAAAREADEAEGSADDELLDGDDFDEDLDEADEFGDDDDDDLDEDDDLDDEPEADGFGTEDADDEFDGIDIDALDDSADEGDSGDVDQSGEPSGD
jgi:Protein of unknown function (DUF3027)